MTRLLKLECSAVAPRLLLRTRHNILCSKLRYTINEKCRASSMSQRDRLRRPRHFTKKELLNEGAGGSAQKSAVTNLITRAA